MSPANPQIAAQSAQPSWSPADDLLAGFASGLDVAMPETNGDDEIRT
jgi:hypothetical protein